ncbi:UNVERIFIED_CONTAM: hypothetical protein K2H54_038849 [Gekko kuhli]
MEYSSPTQSLAHIPPASESSAIYKVPIHTWIWCVKENAQKTFAILVKKENRNQKKQLRDNKLFQPSVYTNAKNSFFFVIQKVTVSCVKAGKERIQHLALSPAHKKKLQLCTIFPCLLQIMLIDNAQAYHVPPKVQLVLSF